MTHMYPLSTVKLLSVLMALILLAGCHAPEGWKWDEVEYDGNPYGVTGDQSTAGGNVAYVLVKMTQEKGLMLPKDMPAVPVQDIKNQRISKPETEEYFNKRLRK